MEQKNYRFVALNGKGQEIELEFGNGVFSDITMDEARGLRMGLEIGLLKKYKDVQVHFYEVKE